MDDTGHHKHLSEHGCPHESTASTARRSKHTAPAKSVFCGLDQGARQSREHQLGQQTKVLSGAATLTQPPRSKFGNKVVGNELHNIVDAAR